MTASRIRALLAIVVVSLVVPLAACGGDDGGSAESQHAADTKPAETTTAAKPDCQKARKVFLDALKSSLTITNGGGLKRVSVVKVENPPEGAFGSFATEGVYAVAGAFTGPGMAGTFGIWAASGDMVRTGGGLIIGADNVTREFSEFGAAASNDSPAAEYAAKIADSDAGQQARTCAEGG